MGIKTINTPEKLHQAVSKFLQSDYSHENLVETYNDSLKCVARFRVDYLALPVLLRQDDPLYGLQEVMDWCIKSSKIVDDIISNLGRQIIGKVISQLKKLRDSANRVLTLVDNKLKEQAQKEARAKVENEYKNLNDEASKAEKMPFIQQSDIVFSLDRRAYDLLRREKKDIVQIYLSKDPTFKGKLFLLHDEEINKAWEALNKLIGSDTPTGKLFDIYCKLKDIPLQQQYNTVFYAYSLNDYTDMICDGCERLYASIDTIIKTFEEIQTKAEQKDDLASPTMNTEDHSTKKDFFNNFIKATIKHLPYIGSWLFDVIYGVDGVKVPQKEGTNLENKKPIKNKHEHPYIKAGGNIIAGGDIIVGNENVKDSPTKNKEKWYQNRTIQAAFITAFTAILVGIITIIVKNDRLIKIGENQNSGQQLVIPNTRDNNISFIQNQNVDPNLVDKYGESQKALGKTENELEAKRKENQELQNVVNAYKQEDKGKRAALERAENIEKTKLIVRIFQEQDKGNITKEKAFEVFRYGE